MNIVALSNCPLDPGLGSGRTRLAWSAGLRARGHAVRVVEPTELLGDTGEAPAGRRWRIGWRGWRWLARQDLAAVDLVEFYGSEFWLPTWRLAAKSGRRPWLVAHTDGLELLAAERLAQTEAGGAPSPPKWRAAAAAVLRRGETLAFSGCDAFVTGCELDRDYLAARSIQPAGRMAVIPPGLEPAFLDLPPGGPRAERVAFLGSWIARKGTAHVVAVMVPLLRARPALRLDLFGVGTEAAAVRAEFPADVQDRMTVVPRMSVAEVIAGLSAARVYFFPSEYEGFGLGLAEAMACGCAAVTTPTGFGAELADGREALLCPFGDAAGMRAALERLLDDDALRTQIASAGRQRVQVLRWETSVRRLEEAYQRWTSGQF